MKVSQFLFGSALVASAFAQTNVSAAVPCLPEYFSCVNSTMNCAATDEQCKCRTVNAVYNKCASREQLEALGGDCALQATMMFDLKESYIAQCRANNFEVDATDSSSSSSASFVPQLMSVIAISVMFAFV